MSKDFENESKDVQPVVFEELVEEKKAGINLGEIEKLNDVVLPVRVVFANIKKSFEEVLAFCEGDVIKLNRFAGEPVDILIGDRILAKGEITVVDDCFGTRIVEILPSGERIEPSDMERK